MMETIAGFNLSAVQERLWVWHKQGYTLNNQVRMSVRGAVDRGRIEKAWEILTGRNDILKTCFSLPAGVTIPLQVTRDNYKANCAYRDCSQLEEDDMPQYIADIAAGLLEKKYELDGPGLYDLVLIKNRENAYTLIIQLPAICSDAVTLVTIGKKIMALYNEIDANDDLNYQFTQYANWHNAVLDEKYEGAVDFWQRHFFNGKTCHTLPLATGKKRQPTMSMDCSMLDPGKDLGKKVKEFLTAYQLPVESFFASVWEILISTYFKEEDEIITGEVFSGRTNEVFNEILGPLSMTLPLRYSVNKQEDVLQVMRRINEQRQVLLSWQDNFEWKNSNTDATSGALNNYIPLTFEYIDARTDFDSTQALDHTFEDLISCSDVFDLKLICIEKNEGVQLKFIYPLDRWNEKAIESLNTNLYAYIQRIVDEPGVQIKELTRITEQEKEIVLHVFNDTTREFPVCFSLKQAFEQQVALQANAIAVSAGENALTYKQLNEKANKFARLLIQKYHIGPGKIVALQVTRSAEMIISLLAIVKTGAAYLPIDINTPAERTVYMLEDSQADLIITNNAIDGRWPSINPLLIQHIISCGCTITDVPVNPASSEVAYIIYTSGSTGAPKGVMISNESILNYINWFTGSFRIDTSDRTLLFSSIAFDLCYTSLWSSLLSGCTLYLLEEADYVDPQLLTETLINNKITFIKLTPSHLKLLVGDSRFDERVLQYALRLVVLGGEQIVSDDVARFYKVRNDIMFVNHYGPTETTVGTAACSIPHSDFDTFRVKPVIGKPIANNQIYIVDENGALLPPGRTGEMLVGGKGVALAYLGKEELTREKFIDSPYNPDQRIYCTGDLVRWTATGEIEFLGRKDGQLKIRGYRIEAGEIENRLQLYPGIQSVAVTVQQIDNDYHVIAFFTAATKLSVPLLREYLEKYLPAYMVPSYFAQPDRLPLTPNGKIDRKAIPLFTDVENEEGGIYSGPGNLVEEKLLKIWRQLLSREKISVQQNFFAIGGHSLKAVQMLSGIYKEFEVKLEIKDLFDHPTIETLARKIAGSGKVSFLSLASLPVLPHYETSHAQKRLWMLTQLQENQLSYNMSAAYRFEGELRIDVFERVFLALLERHESLRTVFENVDGDIRQKILPANESGFYVRFIDITNEAEKEKAESQLIQQETTVPFDLTKGPLLRAALIRKEAGRYIFLFTMHHIISDAWSLEVLLKEFLLLYECYSESRSNPLPPLSIQYKEYAAWHNRQVKNDTFLQHKKYWLQELHGELPVLALPVDFLRPKFKTNHGESIGFVITSEQANGLKTIALEQEATLFMILLATVQALLHRYTGQEDIITGSPIAGRDHADLENQIGLFLNNISIRTRFNGADRFIDLLQQVKEKCMLAYEHQAYPFDLLVSDLNSKRDLSRSPVFDVVVVLQNARLESAGEKEMKDVQVAKFDSGFRASTIDIRIVFTEIQDVIGCVIEYNTDLYKKETIVTFFNNLSLLIDGVIADANTRIFDLAPVAALQKQVITNLSTTFNI